MESVTGGRVRLCFVGWRLCDTCAQSRSDVAWGPAGRNVQMSQQPLFAHEKVYTGEEPLQPLKVSIAFGCDQLILSFLPCLIPLLRNPSRTLGCISCAYLSKHRPLHKPFVLRYNQVGQGYDAESGVGKRLWDAVSDRLIHSPPQRMDSAIATIAAIESGGFGKPQIILPRLGQGSFRVLVREAYERRCAITGERTLPVLDTAHIMPYSVCQRHELSNGLLMRSDLHRLFDGGY